MTKDNKILIAAGGLGICLYLGWAFQFLWILYFIALLVVVIVPTKPSSKQPTDTVSVPSPVTQPGQVSNDVVRELQSAIDAEQNKQVAK